MAKQCDTHAFRREGPPLPTEGIATLQAKYGAVEDHAAKKHPVHIQKNKTLDQGPGEVAIPPKRPGPNVKKY